MAGNPVVDRDQSLKIRTDFYAKLGVQVGPLSKKDSKTLAKLAKEDAKAASKADKEAHEKARKVAKHKLLYEDRRQRAEATIAELRDYSPAADAMISRFIGSLLDADLILNADPEAYEAANKALHAESVSKAIAQAEKAWAKAEKDARKDKASAPAYAQVDALRQSLAKARVILSDADVDARLERVLEAERALLAAAAEPKAVAGIVARLDRFAVELSDAEAQAEKARAAAQASRVLADRALAQIDAPDPLGSVVTSAQRATLQRQRTDAETAIGSRDFVLAKTLFDDLGSAANGHLGSGSTQRADWAKRAGELPQLVTDVKALADSATSPMVRNLASELGKQVGGLAKMKIGIDIDFAKAIQRLDDAKLALAAHVAEESLFVGFAAQRQAAAERIARLDEAAEVAFQPLRAAVLAVTDGKENDLADPPFLDRLERVRRAWKSRLASAQDSDTLNEEAAKAELIAIRRDLAAAAGDSALLGKLIDGETLRKAQEAYRQARAAAQPELTGLTNMDALAGAKILAAVEAVHKRLDAKATAGDYESAATEVALLASEAQAAAQTRLSLVSGLQMRLEQVLAPVPAQLDAMLAAIRKMSDAAGQKPHIALHETLQTSLAELRAMGKLQQVPLLEEAIDDGLKLANDVALSVAAATQGEPPGGGDVLSFDDAKKRLAKLGAKLADADVQMYLKVSAFDAEQTRSAIEKGLGSTTLSVLEKSLEELAVTVAKLRREATAAKAVFEKFVKAEVAPVKDRLDAAPFKDAKSYVASVKGRLASVRSDAQFEGGLADARAALQKIATELDEIAASGVDETGTPRALAEKEKAALEAERASEIEKTRYETEVVVLEKRIEGAKGLYPDDHEGLRQSLRDAKKAAAKGSNYEDAREQLRSIRQRLALLMQNPHGLGIHVRRQLPAVNRRYKAAVSAYWAGLGAVRQAIAALQPVDLPEGEKKKLYAELDAVRVLYNPAVFDRPIELFVNEATETTVRAAQREAALRDARRLSAYVKDDLRLQELADTPFHPSMRGLLSELRLALLDLENNLLVSM